MNHLSDFFFFCFNINNGVGLCTKYDITTVFIFSGQTIQPRTIVLLPPKPGAEIVQPISNRLLRTELVYYYKLTDVHAPDAIYLASCTEN